MAQKTATATEDITRRAAAPRSGTISAVAAERKEAVLRGRELTTRLDRLTIDLADAVSGFTIA